jgi:predicted hydrocarbon binding protein
MHGIIFSQLKTFVIEGHGDGVWKQICSGAGLPNKLYLATSVYPDDEITRLVASASQVLGAEVSVILEAFGKALVPGLLSVYGASLKPQWKTLDVLENVETTIHAVVRRRDPGATPPALESRRNGKREVEIVYRSQRKMCALARGIVMGIADHFKERVSLTEMTCMLRGGPSCRLVVVQTG